MNALEDSVPKKKSKYVAPKAEKEKEPDRDQCSHIFRSGPLLPERFGNVQTGGASLEQCPEKCYPGLNVCYEHADKATLDVLLQSVRHELWKQTETTKLLAALCKDYDAKLKEAKKELARAKKTKSRAAFKNR